MLLWICCCGILSAQTYHIGDLYTAPDGSRGIVYYLHPDGSGGWVVALNDASASCAWGVSGDDTNLVNITSSQNLMDDTAGYANTLAIRTFQNNNSSYAAGVVDFDNGWVLPAPAQLSMLFAQLPIVEAAIVEAGGTALSEDYYWSSAERQANYAWKANFDNGKFEMASKANNYCHVREVRSFRNSPVQYDTTLTYLWTPGGSTQPSILVTPSQTTNYSVTVSTSYGCSATVDMTITVNRASTGVDERTVCDSLRWIDGVLYTTGAHPPGTDQHHDQRYRHLQ